MSRVINGHSQKKIGICDTRATMLSTNHGGSKGSKSARKCRDSQILVLTRTFEIENCSGLENGDGETGAL